MPHPNTYLKLLKKQVVPFDCPHCNESVTAVEFENHCSAKHQLVDRCVWCFGNETWPPNKKNVDHLVKCFSKFTRLRSRMTAAPLSSDLTPMCEAGNSFGRSVHEGLPKLPADPLKVAPHGLSFQSDGINSAVASVKWYLDAASATDWHHVMVRAPAYPSFKAALDDDENCGSIPFSCFCDGGDGQHQHLIVVARPKGAFNKVVWKKINCHRKNSNVRKQPIESPFQLVNLMGHLSQRKSECQFSFRDLNENNDVGEERHFNIVTPLPAVYKLVAVMQWEGGLAELINHAYRHADPKRLVTVAEKVGGLWGVRIGDLLGVEACETLPVSERFRPCSRSESLYLHLVNGRKLYFEEGERRQGDDASLRCIRNEIWFPTPYQQRCIDLAKPVADRLFEMRVALERSGEECRRRAEVALQLQDENKSLKRKLDDSKEEFKKLQEKHIVLLERENDVLRTEMCKRRKAEEDK